MLAQLPRHPVKPLLCIIGEPTELKPVLGQIRQTRHTLRCTGGGVSFGLCAPKRQRHRVCGAVDRRPESNGLATARSELHDSLFDPPFSTVQTDLISGGKALKLNVVPADCPFDFEVRALPGQDPQAVTDQLARYAEQQVLPHMRAVNGQSSICLSELSAYPELLTDTRSHAVRLISQFCGSSAFATVAFGTEGGLLDAVGIHTVVCGPGSMDQGHKGDEFISVEQLDACDAMLERIARSL